MVSGGGGSVDAAASGSKSLHLVYLQVGKVTHALVTHTDPKVMSRLQHKMGSSILDQRVDVLPA